ncbi:MAG: aldo/keto reductase [Christensenella sp.]|nr:aldo/keto reductase [Christensenella sp.]
MQSIPELTLRSGITLPHIGLGTYSLKGQAGANAIANGIRLGYRLLDSAFNYENEGTLGAAIRSSGIPREELLVTSKLPGRHHAYNLAIQTIEESLFRAGLSYYDMYLIHWPNPRVDLYVEAWQAILEAKKRGLVRVAGVCNFLPEHLERLWAETGELPEVNQIELHPYFNQAELREYHKKNKIQTESWSPLGRGSDLLQNNKIVELAKKYDKTPSQIVLRWHIQLGALPIPKSTGESHLLQNLSVFDFALDAADEEQINLLARADGRLHDQDPAVYEEF